MDYINNGRRETRVVTGLARTVLRLSYASWAALAFTAVTVPTIALLAVVPGQGRRRQVVRHAAGLVLLAFGARPRITGLAALPAEPCVVVANHASYLDGLILTAALPPRFSFVIKREMTRVPLAHFLLRRIGSHFLERFDGPRRSSDARRIMRAAAQESSLVFFPEGTFAPDAGLRPFRGGAFQVARRSGRPLVPVAILGSRRMLPARRWFLSPGRLEVRIETPVCSTAPEDTPQGLARRCRRRILPHIGEPDLATQREFG